MSPTICVYAIMRDEADNVAAWAETTLDADKRFVLDTGSLDGTITELDVHGIMCDSAFLDPFRFDDARNIALAMAPAADLYLRLDADETLPEDWRAQIDEVYDERVARYRYRVRNTSGIWGQITRDDLHQRPGFRWKYPTHEVLVGSPVAVDMPRLVVTHTHQGTRSHHRSNLAVLADAVREYPGDPRMAFYLAREFWYAGQWSDCRLAMSNFLALPDGWGAERCEAYRILAAIDDYPERWLWKAVGECPERREPWCDLARLFIREERWGQAEAMIVMSDAREDDTIYTTDPRCWDEAYSVLRTAVFARALEP